jgi:hypothetical protein
MCVSESPEMRLKQFWDDDDGAPKERASQVLGKVRYISSFSPKSDARKNNNAFFFFSFFFSFSSSSEEKQISPRNPLLILFLLLVQTVRTVFSSVFSPHERLLDSRNQRRDFPGVRVRVLRVDTSERTDCGEIRVEIYAQSGGFV